MKKKILIIILAVILFFGGLIIFEKLTVKRHYYGVGRAYEENGVIYIETSNGTSMGYIYDCKLIDMGDGVHEVRTYGSLFSGKEVYEFDNKDGHIKEIRRYDEEGNYELIYSNKKNIQNYK